jgi:putative spermidine/putrescine transport system ATP-binding protein
MATRITLERCAKTFADGTRALEPIDLAIEPGECLVLLGPSGCGKTTLLRLIAGLAEPDAGGRIAFDGTDVTARPIETRRVGMVFQSYALFPNMNVAQNIGYGLRIRGDAPAAIEARVAEMLRLTQLEAFGTRRVGELSGGQKQRVALARAVAIEPSVLLLDEPLTALDAKLRESLRIELKRLLGALDVTSVFVTHDQAEAMALGDRIAVLSKGRIEQIGSAQDIYARPATRFVAGFVGQVNRLDLPGRGEVLVRPEHVGIVAPGAGAFDAVVALSTFLGNLSVIELRGDEGQTLLAETRAPLAAGSRVGIALDPATFLEPRS